ncbi:MULTISPECIES: hypothetical protein [Paenibacillus]|uniref:hypothetical protein n=1 Tax=Paenibacillus TaxID=44249 RepID=UPI0009A6E713|nr:MULTISPECIES: hypothetical protein [Paenibacillus]MCZ1269053.1 hypothetical protein [Paenibacillus tundrae]SLK16368.1 hypothetical protein SAMN06272722_110147 [Paenibacillus sp. RU5A]SOC74350.1 hypothetical protein SAMN05880581_110147 [Paenibacillus sp. RU26A]SOC76470.1 hypothetical protein SAMN05880586_110147 [Paenibacillus sp. RU5M]
MSYIELADLLRVQRFRTVQEKQTQLDVENFLISINAIFEREKRLSASDIPDFLINGVVLEVKTKYSRMAIYKQLERYSKHEEVKALILLTGTSIQLPAEINGKPALVVSLGEGWL